MNQAYIVCGSPGAGKTTYAKKLAADRKTVLLDIDTASELLVQAGMAAADLSPDDRDSPVFKQYFREPIYATLFAVARENLPILPVVIVGPFTRELRNAKWPEELANLLGFPVEIHFVVCRPEIRRQRLIERGNPRDTGKLADWDAHTQYYGDESPPQFSHVLVDTSEE